MSSAFDKHWYARKSYKNATELSKVIGLNRAYKIYHQAFETGECEFLTTMMKTHMPVQVVFPGYENSLCCRVLPVDHQGNVFDPNQEGAK
jgi:hypothetical protein